jgi:hypothetical protein
MSYPIILNGDHAEFEAEHKDMPPHERPDWPLSSFDARDWAKEFMKIADKGAVVDEAWMTTWFANALMRGFDEHSSRVPNATAATAAERERCAKIVEGNLLLDRPDLARLIRNSKST